MSHQKLLVVRFGRRGELDFRDIGEGVNQGEGREIVEVEGYRVDERLQVGIVLQELNEGEGLTAAPERDSLKHHAAAARMGLAAREGKAAQGVCMVTRLVDDPLDDLPRHSEGPHDGSGTAR